jgi:3-hydroxyacyl-CoA dehydrogenase
MPLPSQTAAVLGGGTMGADIAAIFLAGGWRVSVVETRRRRPASATASPRASWA